MKAFAIAVSIAIFFLIYWLLPNGKVPARAVLPAAVIMGLLSEILKYSYILALPRPELPGSVRAVRALGQHDVLGISVWASAADAAHICRRRGRDKGLEPGHKWLWQIPIHFSSDLKRHRLEAIPFHKA